MSNYPPGVTGNEYEIAGPDAEWEETKEVACDNDECPDFEKEHEEELLLQSYRGTWWTEWQCPKCKTYVWLEGEVEDTRDYEPDDYWD